MLLAIMDIRAHPISRSEAVLLPVFRSEQNNASTLHEQHAQIAVPAPADVTEDRPIARRHLLRHQAEPCSEVTPFGKGSAITNGRHLLRSR